MGPWRTQHILALAAVILFIIAFCVAVGLFGHNYPAWIAAGLAAFAAAFLPFRSAP